MRKYELQAAIFAVLTVASPTNAFADSAKVLEQEGIRVSASQPVEVEPTKLLCMHETGPVVGSMMVVVFAPDLQDIATDRPGDISNKTVNQDWIRFIQSGFITAISRINGRFTVTSVSSGNIVATGKCEVATEKRKF